jgi:hypothetical protein
MILEFYGRTVDFVILGKNTNNGNFERKLCYGDLVYYREFH